MQLCSHECLQTAEDKRKFDRLIMDDTVDINCSTDASGNNPLMLLCKHRNADSILQDVQTLLTRRKDIDVKSAGDIVHIRKDIDFNKKYDFSRMLNKYP